VSDARRELLGGLIDFAGLFPPAALDVPGAVAGYLAAKRHPHGWMVDRFVAPAAKVEAVGEAARAQGAMLPWRVALVVDVLELRAAAEAAGRVADALVIDVVELRPAEDVAGAVRAARAVFPDAAVYAEVAPASRRRAAG
jgi:hypothetical protein